jgi:hypothetical protein
MNAIIMKDFRLQVHSIYSTSEIDSPMLSGRLRDDSLTCWRDPAIFALTRAVVFE